MDMYKIMDVLVKNGYDGTIYVDHVLRYDEQTGGEKDLLCLCNRLHEGLDGGGVSSAEIKVSRKTGGTV